MSLTPPQFGHTSTARVPVLTPMYGAQHDSFRASTDGTYVCGSGQTSEFSLNFPGVEAAHCSFIRAAGTFSVNRQDGRVWVNDLPVNGIRRLQEGDVISFGSVSFRLEFIDATSRLHVPVFNSLATFAPSADPSSPSVVERAIPAQQILSGSSASMPSGQDASVPPAIHHELIEHQRLLAMRQQQLDELTKIVRERERSADDHQAELGKRASLLTAQANELASLQEQLVTRELEVSRTASETDGQLRLLEEKKRELEVIAEQNSLSSAAAAQAQAELAQHEAELMTLREQTLEAQAELERQNSELLLQREESDRRCRSLEERHRELETFAEQNSLSFAAAEQAQTELARREAELLAKAEILAQQAAALEHREQSLFAAEQLSAHASAISATRCAEQQAAIAAQEEAAVREHQDAVAAQTVLRELEQSIADRQSELRVWESEIEARASELSARLAEIKSYRREQRAALASAENTGSHVTVEFLEQQAASLQKEREDLDRRAGEIVAGEKRLTEKMTSAASITQAAESERTALQNANKDLLCERNALSQLRLDLTSRESGITEREVLVAHQLDDLRSRFAVLDLRAAEQKLYEAEIDSRSAEVHRRIQLFRNDLRDHRETTRLEHSADGSATTVDDAASELLAVRQQLDTVQQDLKTSHDDRSAMVAERDLLMDAVRELQKALQDARQDVEDANRMKNESVLLEQRLQQAFQTCEDRSRSLQSSESKLLLINEQLDSLRAELTEVVQERDDLKSRMATSTETLKSAILPQKFGADGEAAFETLSRELDQRAELLDQRDLDVCERMRKLEQSENDIDAQRRQLLEARQQLEQARAEIQVALRNRSEHASDAAAATHELSFDSTAMPGHRVDQSDSMDVHSYGKLDSGEFTGTGSDPAVSLRSELAGLFGLSRSPADHIEFSNSAQSEDVDLSEPTGENKSIVFHFGPDTPKLVEPAAVKETVDKPEREENSDDFVRDYMEVLLSRSRQTAGTVLPGELKAGEKKSEPAAAPAAKTTPEPAKKTGPKIKSFIEQYMAGNLGDLESGEPLISSEPVSEATIVPSVPEQLRVHPPRQKMDLQKLKENMDSFRTLSTQSVENALTSHAIKLERHGFTGRSAFAAILLIMTLVVGIANALGVIDSPMLTWVLLTSAIAILTELYRRYVSIKVHTRNPLDLLFSTDELPASTEAAPNMMAAAPIPASYIDSTHVVNDHVTTLKECDLLPDSSASLQQWLMETKA